MVNPLWQMFYLEEPSRSGHIDELGICRRYWNEEGAEIAPNPNHSWGKFELVIVIGGKASKI